ncbi:MAG: ABC transporter substrate-binding protein [Magnetococcales bacterium]|nr:ABC transporter substrate-binding protein [Magnetococcales bacterium]
MEDGSVFQKDGNANTLPHLSRRNLLDWLAAGGLAALLGTKPSPLMAAPTDKAVDETLRIGYLPITDATPLLVAHALGYFEDEGLKVAKPQPVKSWPTLVRGFAEGHFNLVHLLKPIPVWMRYNNHFPVKIVAWAHLNGSAIVVGEGSGIRDFRDLGGQRMAIPAWYSMHNIVLQQGLRKAGIRPVVDRGGMVQPDTCALTVIPPPMMVKSLATRRIAGYTVAEPFNAIGELTAKGRVMRFTGDIWRNHPCCVICMHERDTTHRPQWSQKVIQALVRAELYAAHNKREVAHLLSKEGKGYLSSGSKMIERAMTFYDPDAYTSPRAIRHQREWQNGRIDFSPYPYPSATRKIVEMMKETVVDGHKTFLEPIEPEFVAKDLVVYDYVTKALDKYPQWKRLPGVNADQPFDREELLII